jgi:Mn-dependent DtxR family transcriptional regulator
MTPTQQVFTYVATVYQANQEAEVSALELQHELGLDGATVAQCLRELKSQDLVQFDPLLTNLWLRITDKGISLVGGA